MYCTARSDNEYYCTLEAEHPGPHVAEAFYNVVAGVWYDGGEFQPTVGAADRIVAGAQKEREG